MYCREYLRKIFHIAFWGALGIASGCSSESGSATQDNELSNGFRLVSVSVDNLFFDSLDYTRVLEYNAESTGATVTKTSFDDGVEETSVRLLEIDAVGRPAVVWYTKDSTEYRHEFTYDNMGRMSEYNSNTGSEVYQYSEGLLREISYSRLDGLIHGVRLEYNYNSNFRLISTVDRMEGTFTDYEYNATNQIIRAWEKVTEDRPLFSHSFEYDDVGNLVKEVITRQFGDVYQINDYVYEETNEATYNYGLMRMKVRPFDSIIFGFVRF